MKASTAVMATCSLVSRPLPVSFFSACKKNWEWPRDEAIASLLHEVRMQVATALHGELSAACGILSVNGDQVSRYNCLDV